MVLTFTLLLWNVQILILFSSCFAGDVHYSSCGLAKAMCLKDCPDFKPVFGVNAVDLSSP
jgi:hypothetical protein